MTVGMGRGRPTRALPTALMRPAALRRHRDRPTLRHFPDSLRPLARRPRTGRRAGSKQDLGPGSPAPARAIRRSRRKVAAIRRSRRKVAAIHRSRRKVAVIHRSRRRVEAMAIHRSLRKVAAIRRGRPKVGHPFRCRAHARMGSPLRRS